MEVDDDKILYQNFLEGSQNAFEQIMDKYAEKLIYFIFKFVKNIEVAEDLSQDVFVYVLINKNKYNFKYSLKTYLYIIGRSKALDYLKKNKRNVEFKEDYLYREELIEDVEKIVFDNLEKQKLKEILNSLNEEQRKNDISS
jgi:RNA polymerase sigma-70 factor (ECF subfamily)